MNVTKMTKLVEHAYTDGYNAGAGEQDYDLPASTAVGEAIEAFEKVYNLGTEFRRAANSIALEAGVISVQVSHTQAAESVTGDQYFLQLIAESELRLKALTARCERLRKASSWFVELGATVSDAMRGEGRKGRIAATKELQDALEYAEVDTHV